tara:strand:- start:96 stop:308 length:213 start_codon:yes stop_codon:yes gene_type:complete
MASRKHHNKKNEMKTLKNLVKDGFTVSGNGGSFKIMKDNGPIFTYHSAGAQAYHPLRRFLKEHYNYILDQ